MLLAIDVGNTNIVLGIFEGGRLAESWRLATHRERTADEIGVLVTELFDRRGVSRDRIEGIAISSVVPPLTGSVATMARKYFGREPFVLESAEQAGIPVRYENPAEVGADRLCNAVAAIDAYGLGRPLIVVDFGTATTFDAISAKGEYLGGAICPGIEISADALFQRAARLPRVDVRRPRALVGRTTVESMQSGLFFGYVAMVEGIVTRMRHELGGAAGDGPAKCVATGGLASVIASETRVISDVSPDLTLHGLRLVWERNRAGQP
jgi:type III pantothenate kinase